LAEGKLPNATQGAQNAATKANIGRDVGAVFISYASEDAEPASRICDALRSAGIEVWFDQRELRGGDVWDQTIRARIRDCTLFIPIISRHTQQRLEGYFRREWKLAVNRTNDMAEEKPFLVPVVVDHTKPQEAVVPEQFRGLQWTVIVDGVVPPSFAERVSDLLLAQGYKRGTIASRQRAGEGQRAPAFAAANHSLPWNPVRVAAAVQDGPMLSKAHHTRRRLNWAIVGVSSIALAYFAVDKFWLSKQVAFKQTADTAKSFEKISTVMPTSANDVPGRSIAVLPFIDMSEKHDQEYFADGLTEELIDRFSQSPDLKVIARTSSFHYKGRNDDVREIANALGVSHLLEGSVRWSGRQLRVTVQLIRASDGSHIWSDTYDQSAQDIFRVQREIAATVTRRLNASLASSGQPDRARPTNFAAYEMVLQGDSHRGFNIKDINASIDYYRDAIALDAGYALARARLAVSLARKTQLADFEDIAGLRQEAEQAARQALQIDPNLGYGYFALGLALDFEKKTDAAEAAYQHANLLQPGIADRLLANIELRRSGNLSAAIDVYQKLIQRDPKYAALYNICAGFLFHAGRYQESETMLRQLIALEPGFTGARAALIRTLVFKGAAAEAQNEMSRQEDADSLAYEKVIVFWALGRRDESTAALNSIERVPGNWTTIAELLAFRGETDEALIALNKAVDAGEDMVELTYDRHFERLRSDPRFAALLRRANVL
jgi:TolB-like protein/tetratricopeptide (TPR) repeat protein